jgi:hypothetical protein
MAAPAVTGIIALMLESYANSVDAVSLPLNSTIKAILVQTAVDQVHETPDETRTANRDTDLPVTYHAGPDWATGYGLIDALEATELIADPERWIEDEITEGRDSVIFHFEVPSVSNAAGEAIKVTLAWDDRPYQVEQLALTADVTPRLVNDLDLLVIAPDRREYKPLVLPPLQPNDPYAVDYEGLDEEVTFISIAAAREDEDHVNNVEQVVAMPQAGTWRVVVKSYGELRRPPQHFSVVLPFAVMKGDSRDEPARSWVLPQPITRWIREE